MAYKGRYTPRNPSKYNGDPTKIIYRSGLELRFMRYLDEHPDVISWHSEETIIKYRCPTDGRIHRYFVDFWYKARTLSGEVKEFLIEIKPKSQTVAPKQPKRKTRRYIREVMTYAKNEAKWEAAKAYAKGTGMEFKIITERDLGGY